MRPKAVPGAASAVTLKKQWPTCDFLLTSPPIPYEHYSHPDVIDFDKLINELVGQVDRVEKYPSRGFTEEDEVPEEVLVAKSRLVELGYGEHLVRLNGHERLEDK